MRGVRAGGDNDGGGSRDQKPVSDAVRVRLRLLRRALGDVVTGALFIGEVWECTWGGRIVEDGERNEDR